MSRIHAALISYLKLVLIEEREKGGMQCLVLFVHFTRLHFAFIPYVKYGIWLSIRKLPKILTQMYFGSPKWS